jgi:Secretion system C-terminal sorting domain
MKKIYYFLLFLPYLNFGQIPVIQWDRTIGGNDLDMCTQVIQTKDNGYIAIGFSDSGISFDKTQDKMVRDYWIIKTNSLGNIVWQKTYGGFEEDNPNRIIETTDGGYLITGTSLSPISGDNTCGPSYNPLIGPEQYTWLLKLNSFGNIVWQKAIISVVIFDVLQTVDGGYVASGTKFTNPPGWGTEDYHIVKLDLNGNTVWERTLAGDNSDYYSKLILANDGGFIIGGHSMSQISLDKTEGLVGPNAIGNYGSDIWILKIDAFGQIVWQKDIGGSEYEGLYNIKKNVDNTYTLICNSNSPVSGDKTVPLINANDFWIVNIDNLGNIISQNAFGFDFSNNHVTSIEKDDGGNFLICGFKNWLTTNSEIFVEKLNPFGGIMWQKQINANNTEESGSISKTNDGGYILGCSSDSPISGDKTDNSRDNSMDYWLVKLTPENLSTTNLTKATTNIYPNPTNGTININFGQVLDQATLKLTNLLGQVVSSKTVNNIESTTYELNEPNGIFFLEIESQNSVRKVFKIVKN